MRILVLSPFVPWPPDDGGRIRVRELMRAMAERHEVELATLADGTERDREAIDALRTSGVDVHAVERQDGRAGLVARAVATRRSLNAVRCWDRRLVGWVEERLATGRIDAVHCEFSMMAPYRPHPPAGALVPWLLDAQNVEFRVNETLMGSSTGLRGLVYDRYARREIPLRRAEEIAAWRSMDRIVAVSELDATVIAEHSLGVPVHVVENGVDLDRVHRRDSAAGIGPSAVFVGKLDYRPNTDAVDWFVSDVLPLVREQEPSFALTVVGANPPARLVQQAGRLGIEVTGRVDDPIPHLHRATLSVVPLRSGSGSRLKILEAMAAGVPVVSTTQGAEGLDVEAGRHLVLADEPATMATAIVDLVRDPVRQAELVDAGRHLVEERYGWRAIAGRLLDAYEALAAMPRARP